MNLGNINVKNAAIGTWIVGAGLYWLASMPSSVVNAVSGVANSVSNAIWTVSGWVSSVASGLAPYVPDVVSSGLWAIWLSAPFAAPMIAWGFVWKKVSDALEIENAALKKITSFFGTFAWAVWAVALAGSSTMAAPILTLAGTGLWLYYWLKYGYKWIGYVGRKIKWWVSWVINA